MKRIALARLLGLGFSLSLLGSTAGVSPAGATSAEPAKPATSTSPTSPTSPSSQANLGRIDFPVTSSSEVAREHFVRGVLALHSFFYDEALDEFRAATQAEPSFAMGYWGEAMALNETIWEWQDLEGGRRALARIAGVERLPPKEQGLIAAIKLLYGEGSRPARSLAYSREIEQLHKRFGEDDELAAFYALSLLGTMVPGENTVPTRMRAGSVALEVLAKNPLHPGAAHYVIHSFDDPTHAILALPAARRYARIAPEAFHARHMPSHIFVQLGMWDEAVASCESAWAASRAWIARRKHPLAKADFHSLNWLVSLYLQQGRRGKAEAVLQTFRDAIALENATLMRRGYAEAVLSFLQETGAWERTETYLAPLGKPATLSPAERAVACHPTAGNAPAGVMEQLTLLTIRGRAAAARADDRRLAEMKSQADQLRSRLSATALGKLASEQRRMEEAASSAYLALARHRPQDSAREFLKAAAIDDELGGNDFADPGTIPWEEEAGYSWLLAGQAKEATKAFAASLAKRPGRTRSLLGAARAAELQSDAAAVASYYGRAAANLKSAEPGAPGLTEARARTSR